SIRRAAARDNRTGRTARFRSPAGAADDGAATAGGGRCSAIVAAAAGVGRDRRGGRRHPEFAQLVLIVATDVDCTDVGAPPPRVVVRRIAGVDDRTAGPGRIP